jgi:hypothetical protein
VQNMPRHLKEPTLVCPKLNFKLCPVFLLPTTTNK